VAHGKLLRPPAAHIHRGESKVRESPFICADSTSGLG